jgi:hypothetical protein
VAAAVPLETIRVILVVLVVVALMEILVEQEILHLLLQFKGITVVKRHLLLVAAAVEVEVLAVMAPLAVTAVLV